MVKIRLKFQTIFGPHGLKVVEIGFRIWNLEPLFGCGLADVLICRKGRDVQPLQCLAHRGERRAAMPNHAEEMVGKMGNSTYNCEHILICCMYGMYCIYIYVYR